jgi:hypothetical protein
MASFIYNSCPDDLSRGAIDFDTDTFKILLVTSSYTPNKGTHDKRDDITNQVTGTGYTAGGQTSACTVTKITASNRVTVVFAEVAWTAATITAAGAVIYKSRGGDANADELVAFIDFGANIVANSGTFTVKSSTITLQN